MCGFFLSGSHIDAFHSACKNQINLRLTISDKRFTTCGRTALRNDRESIPLVPSIVYCLVNPLMADAVFRNLNFFVCTFTKRLFTLDFHDSSFWFIASFCSGLGMKLTIQSAKELIFDLTLLFNSLKILLLRLDCFAGGMYLFGVRIRCLSFSGTGVSSKSITPLPCLLIAVIRSAFRSL